MTDAIIASLNPAFDYYVCFDQLDRGFETTDKYKNRLIGLLLAARNINVQAAKAGKKLSVVIFLRDDIYQILSFEDKNKLTENAVARIEWDSARSSKTLKQLMAKRFSTVLKISEDGAWDSVFDEDEKMTGKQTKYQHMVDRTFLRPRDMIKFCNEVLLAHNVSLDGSEGIFSNRDVQDARLEYSRYLLAELDDELYKHIPEYRTYIEILKSMDSLAFTLQDFEEACERRRFLLAPGINGVTILKQLFEFSIIGYYSPGGGGFGGAEYIWRYRDPRSQFNEAAGQFRIHPGLKEALGVKKWVKSE